MLEVEAKRHRDYFYKIKLAPNQDTVNICLSFAFLSPYFFSSFIEEYLTYDFVKI